VLAEEPAMACECLLNPFVGEDVRERQRVLGHERVGDLLKIGSAAVRRIGYILAHEKTLPGEFAASKPRRAYFSSPGKGQILKLFLTKRDFIQDLACVIDQIASPPEKCKVRQCHSSQEPLYSSFPACKRFLTPFPEVGNQDGDTTILKQLQQFTLGVPGLALSTYALFGEDNAARRLCVSVHHHHQVFRRRRTISGCSLGQGRFVRFNSYYGVGSHGASSRY
jgi:hypothetical protein